MNNKIGPEMYQIEVHVYSRAAHYVTPKRITKYGFFDGEYILTIKIKYSTNITTFMMKWYEHQPAMKGLK